MAQLLWDIVVSPLVYVLELVFWLFWYGTDSVGAAIIGLSVVVNLLCLPLYRMADDAQERERAKQAKMKPMVDHIRKTFTGDERHMMLSAYYAEQGYRPVQALAGSLSLLLQIPFFMAAYSFLSGLHLLKGSSFLFLSDLGAPDGLLVAGGLAINVLPIVMTALNCASTAVYTRGLPLRDKVQAYALAAAFLVLLYESPSGLVFYWTCNQLFSLGKNLVLKLWARRRAQNGRLGASSGPPPLNGTDASVGRDVLMSGSGLPQAFHLSDRIKALLPRVPRPTRRATTVEFLLAAALLTCLIGILIPSSVIGDSPTEFVDLRHVDQSPLTYIVHTTCAWGGLIFLWLGTYFLLAKDSARSWIVAALWGHCGTCLLNYFVFGLSSGNISSELVYDNAPVSDPTMLWVSTWIVVIVFHALLFIWFRWNRVVTPTLAVVAAALLAMAVPNVLSITSAYASLRAEVKSNGALAVSSEEASSRVEAASGSVSTIPDGTDEPLLTLSTTERNVVVVFLDRAISGYLPFIMAERPELAAKLDGFTYYPNTLSYGMSTNFGAPALYGGYEYTPAAMNADDTKSIPEKHDEALLVLPTVFSREGYDVTVVDPPYAGSYSWYPDLSIYEGLEDTHAYYNDGSLTDEVLERYGISSEIDLRRQFFSYGFFRVLPQHGQMAYYDDGRYLSTAAMGTPSQELMKHYALLLRLPELCASDSGPGAFVQLANATTHEPDMLQLPDYLPADRVVNTGLEDMDRFTLDDGRSMTVETREQLAHYHVNAGALLRLGEWCDWMREQGVYDNTRIIVVSDHGRWLQQFEEWVLDDGLDVEAVNPLLMVKDFNAHGFTVSDDFMTDADVPVLATEGVVDGPVNPFTGMGIDDTEKHAHEQLVTSSRNWMTHYTEDTAFDTSDAPWYAVSDDIFDLGNWRRLDDDEARPER